jgi:hypothetical protein
MRDPGRFLTIRDAWSAQDRARLAFMSTCRSSAGCEQPAGHGRFGTFCAEHAAALAELRSAHFTAEGTALLHPVTPAEQGPSTEDDALRVAAEVRRGGAVARHVLQDRLGFTYTRFRRAVELAGRSDWIVAERSLAPGSVHPAGPLAPHAATVHGAAVSSVPAL